MYKKKGNLVILSVAFLFFIAGCAGGEGTTTGAPTTPFIGGTEAIQIGFLEGSPPEEVTDQGSFPFQAVVSLKNVGEHDIVKDQIKTSLIGFLASQFNFNDPTTPEDEAFDVTTLTDKELTEDLKGKKRDPDGNIIEPIETFLTFPTDDKNFNFGGNVIGNTVFIFRTDSCFLYSGDARSELCILQNQIDVADDAICKPTESKSVFSSSSPIQVASFRQNVAGSNKIQFSFDVNHVGKGSLFDVSAPEGGLGESLVAYWKFDEGEGITTIDSSENQNTGTLVNDPSWVTDGRFESALSFDGTNRYVSVADNGIFNFGNNDFSILLWANFDVNSGERTLISQRDSSGNVWRLNWNFCSASCTNQLVFEVATGGIFTPILQSSFQPEVGKWYHIALIKNENDYSFYIDGIKSIPATFVGGIPDVNDVLRIGSELNQGFFDGKIDDVRLYNRVLTEAEIETLVQAQPTLLTQTLAQVFCPKDSTLRRTREDSVLVTVDTGLDSASYKLNCVGLENVDETAIAQQQGKVKLVNGKRTITCTLDLPSTRTDFVTPIDIKAEFNYEQSADREVLVKHLLTDP